MADCTLNNNAKNGCQKYRGVIAGMLIKETPFYYSGSDINDIDAIKADLVASTNRLFILQDQDDYENIQQREPQNGTTASGRQQYYGMLAHAFALHERKPRPYDVRKAFLDGGGSQKVYAIPFTNKGYLMPLLLSDGNYHAKEFDMTKILYEAGDYTAAEQMLRYIFTEYNPEQNVEFFEALKPTGYDPNTLDGVNDVEITVSSASATEIVVSVALSGESARNVNSLVTANFQKLDGSGVVEAVTAAYSASDAEYTLTGVGLTSGTLNVIPVASDDYYYEGTASVTVS